MSRNQNHGQNPLPSCMEHFSEIYGTVQPPNKMTKGGLSSRVQWVAKVLDHIWKVTSTVWGSQLP